jgi:hypothetical protein
MLGTYFYNEIIRKTIIAFGTIFNDIDIRRKDNSSSVVSTIKVPLAYGSIQKFLAKINEQPDIESKKGISLPRMSFEMTSLQYDSGRKLTTTKEFKTLDKTSGKEILKIFMPVPYNIGFELNIMSKTNEDALQVVEQILPYFQPSYNITAILIPQITEKKDIPIVLDSIQMRDDYVGDFNSRRTIIYTLNFTAKTYLYGPIPTSTPGIIKKVQVDYHTDTERNYPRSVRYTVSATAVEPYSNNNIAKLTTDFELSQTTAILDDVSSIQVGSRLFVNGEVMLVNSINGNNVKVSRGYSGTTQSAHITGSDVFLITESDDALIEEGDDFGFSGETEFFNDGLVYNPTTDTDVDPSTLT